MADKLLKQWPELYKRDGNGRVRVWNVRLLLRNKIPTIEVSHGLLGGKQKIEPTEVLVGKKIGTKAETTPKKQARNEANSKWVHQQTRERYSTDIGEIDEKMRFAPMLANNFKDVFPDGIDFENTTEVYYAQTKYDGYRLEGIPTPGSRNLFEFVTRKEVSLQDTLKHLQSELADAVSKLPDDLRQHIVIDGELYRHGWALNTISSYAKAYRDETLQLKYYIYDCFWSAGPMVNTVPFSERTTIIKQMFEGSKYKTLVRVPTIRLRSQAQLDRIELDRKLKGYEGLIIRRASGMYRRGMRVNELLKLKEFVDDEFEIVKMDTAKRDFTRFHCVTKEGYPFKALAPGDEAQKRDYINHPDEIIGKLLKVKYMRLTATDKPVPTPVIALGVVGYDWEDM